MTLTQCPVFRTKRWFLLCAFGLAIVTSSNGLANAQFLYVHDDAFSGNRVFGFSIGADASLIPVPGSPIATGGFGATDFDINSINVVTVGNRLYSANVGSNTVSGFSINADGSLTAIPGSPFSLNPFGSPIGVAASADGRLLFVGRGVSFGPGTGIEVFSIAADGSLTLVPGSPFGVGSNGNGFDVIFDPVRNNVISNQNDNNIGVFNVGPSGALTQIVGSPFETATFNNHKMALNANRNLLFVAGGGTQDVSVMTIAPGGALSNAPGSPFPVPASSIGTAVHPSGNFAYFGLEGPGGNIRGFKVLSGGSLTPILGEPFLSGAESPTGLTTDSFGTLLFAANTFGGSISVLRIGQTGELTAATGSPFSFPFNGNPTGIVFVGNEFNICMRDDSNGNLLLFSSSSGAYQFSNCTSITMTGLATVVQRGCSITLQHNGPDRRVVVRLDTCAQKGTASIQALSSGTFTITDKNTGNNNCACGE